MFDPDDYCIKGRKLFCPDLKSYALEVLMVLTVVTKIADSILSVWYVLYQLIFTNPSEAGIMNFLILKKRS